MDQSEVSIDLQLLVLDAVEERVHDNVAALHGNPELDPGLHTLARLHTEIVS